MAEPTSEMDTGERIGLTIVVVIAGLAILRFGGKTFVRRIPGPVMRMIYRRFPTLKTVIRSSVGDVPMLHSEKVGMHQIVESAMTIGFWAANEIDPTVKKAVAYAMDGGLELLEQAVGSFEYIDPAWVDAQIAKLATDKGATVEDDDVASVVTSENGLIQVGMTDAWRIDP